MKMTAGLLLPQVLYKHLHVEIGGNIEVEIIDDGLLVKRVKAPRYELEELLSSCTLQNTQFTAEDIAWLHNKSKGQEEGFAHSFGSEYSSPNTIFLLAFWA